MAKKSFAEINAQYGISSGIDNGEEVIKKYITEASSFLSSVDEKSEKMTYGNANLFDTRRTIYEDLNNTYNSLNLWLSENRSNYTNDQFNKLKSSLKEIKSAIEVANNRYEEMEDYYSQWSSVDEYNNFLEGQKIAEKKNNRPAELGFSLTEGVVGVGRNIGNFITGNDEISAREYANQIMASDNTGFRKFANDTAGAVGGMLPSIALSMVTGGALSGLGVSKATASAIGATAGNVLLSSSAAGGAYTEMKRNGYNDAQAATYGVLVGASEGLLQSALGGIGNLGGTHSLSAQTTKFVSGIDNAFLRYAAKLPLNMASEGMEEAIQTALEPVFKSFVTGEDLEPAEWSEIAYSALVGAASAGLIEGVHTGAHTIGEAHYNSNLKKQYGSVSQDIVNTALQGTTDIEHATEMQEKLDSGKSLSGGNISHLLRSISTNDQAKIQSAVATDLDRRGETGDVQALSEAIAKKIANQPLTASEQKLINNSIYGIDLLQGLDPANIDNNPKLQSWDDSLNPDELAASMIDTEFAENIGTDLINAKQYNKGTGRDVNFLNNPKKRTNVAVDLEDEDKQLPEVSETTSDGSLESASKKYGAQAQAMVHTYIEGQDVEKFDNAYNIAYNMGKDGVSEEYVMKSNALTYLTETQRELAYEAGKESKVTDTSSDKINTTEAENERGVHLRNGSERNRGQNTEEQISSVERGSGQTEGRVETRSRDSEAARLINEGREVTAASLGIPGGTDTKTVRALDSDKDTASMKRGRKLAESRGLKVTYFVGSNLSLKENGKDVSARAYINLSSGEVFVRADHPIHTAEQLLKHELGHDKIKKGEVNREDVRKRLIELVGKENVKAVAEAYELAYRGSDMTAEEIWEECICDALADMNVFSGKEIKPFIDLMLPEVKTAVESTAKSPTQTRGSPATDTKTTFKSAEEAKVSGKVSDAKFSIEFADAIAEKQRKFVEDGMSQISAEEVEKAIADTAQMVNEMKPYANILPQDKVGKTLVKNGSYDVSVENTTVCIRTLAYNSFVDMVSEKVGRPLTQMESFLVSQKLYEIAKEPQCLYCYVSLDRKAFNEMVIRYTEQRDKAISAYEAAGKPKIPSSMNAEWPLFKDFLDGRKPTTNMWDRYVGWLKAYNNGETLVSLEDISTEAKRLDIVENGSANLSAQVKDILKYAQSASWAKKQTQYVAYFDEILKLKPSVIRNLNNHYGMRWYSFSDYSGAFIVENMQQITDAAIRGLKGLSYTKDTDFAEIFAPTGMNINISVYAKKGENGYEIDAKQSANIDEAIRLRNEYPNVGIVVVATDKAGVEWALEQEWSDVVIPFHTVRTGAEVAEFYNWEIFNAEQSDIVTDQNLWDAYVNEVGKKKASKMVYPSEHQNNRETYLSICEKRGLTPRFKSFLSNPNYMKLVNETRQSESQTSPLKAEFNLEAAERSFDKFVEKGGYYEGWYNDGIDVDNEADIVASDVKAGKKANEVGYGRQDVDFDALAKGRKTNREHGKTSRELDTEYLLAVENGDMETAQRLVDEAAKNAGYTVKGLHATNSEFTEFDISKTSENNFHGKGIYFTNSVKDLENNYENHEGPDPWQKIEARAYELAYDKYGISYEDTLTSDTEIIDKLNECYDIAIEEFNKSGRRITAYLRFDNPLILEKGMQIPYDYSGYDGIIDKQVYENIGHSGMDENTIHYVVFNPNNIKSADPVTYDDNGNVIPLSERFNTQEKDIRYSRELYDEDLYTATDDFIRDVLPQDRHAFARSLANKTTGMTKGEIRTIYVSGYVFKADGYMHGKLIGPYNSKTKKMLEVNSNIYEGLNKNNKDAALWTEDEVRNAKRGIGSNSNLSYRRRSSADDRLFDESSERNASGDNERIRQTPRTEAEIDEIVNKLRQMYGLDTEDNKYSRELDVVDYMNETSEIDESEPISKRTLLANALETTAVNDIERKRLEDYKKNVSLLDAEESKLKANRDEAKELRFKKGRTAEETKRLKALDIEANVYKNNINTYDKRLLNLESTTALKGVLNREVEKMRKKAMAKGREVLSEYKEGRNKTAMRHKIKDVVSDLNKLLNNPTKDKHVPIELQKPVAEALAAVNMDTVGAAKRIANKQAEMMNASTPEQVEKLAKEIENIRQMGGKIDEKLSRLKNAYDSIINSEDPLIANSYDEVISSTIQNVMEFVGKTPLKDMTLHQLEAVYDMYRMVLHSIRNANKAFKAQRSENIATIAESVMKELDTQKKRKQLQTKSGEALSQFNWNNQKPVYAFERIGSNALTEIFKDIRAGEDVWAVDMSEAFDFSENQKKQYNFKTWDFKKKFTFTSSAGIEFSLSLSQIMSIYAYAKRGDQAVDHLKNDGFVFDGLTKVKKKGKLGVTKTYQLKDSTAYNINEEIISQITSKLTAEQKAFADAMQEYLSGVMGEKGNEVSLALYGVKLFKEINYFPLKSAPQFLERAREQAQGEVKLKNKGFTKETTPKAKNPIVLSDFMEVWASHVNEMSMYHGFTLALEDFYRVYNFKTHATEDVSAKSVISSIEAVHGEAAVEYVDQLLKDLNGGARSDQRETFAKKLVSNFKKTAVLASFSVVIQQPSAIVRATALVNPKYFIGKKVSKARHKATWAELKKYAPVAAIKEMGYFDVGMGRSSVEWLINEKNIGEKIEDGLSKLPALADKYTWCAIWQAVKRETAKKNPTLKTNSEEFLKIAGERFTEVIVKTQVYDSTLARSANMRSKSAFMSMWTAFMAEPTTSINMVQDALHKGNRKYAARAIGAVLGAVVVNSALASIVYAARDDDEDETMWEKYLSRLTTEILDGINPITYFPFFKDVWSAAQGYDLERSDMTLITAVMDSLEELAKVIIKDRTDMDEEELKAHNEKLAEAILSNIDNLSSLIGIPVKNIRRDINGVINGIKTIVEDANGRKTTSGSLGDNILDDVKNSVPVWGWFPDESKGEKLYDAIIKGDTAYVDRLKSSYKSESAYESAIRKALRENDPRIKEAAKASVNGDTAKYTKIIDEIIAEGKFDKRDIISAVRSEIDKLSPKEEEESESKELSKYKVSDYYNAITADDSSMIYATKLDIIDTAVANGADRDAAESNFNSNFARHLNELYLDGDISLAKAEEYLVTYGGKKEEEAKLYTQKWVFDDAYPDYKSLSKEQVDKYYKAVKDTGVSVEYYYDFVKKAAKATGVDNNNDGKADSGTLQAEIMEIIDSMPLTKDQKTALIRTKYEDLKLYKMPWNREIK